MHAARKELDANQGRSRPVQQGRAPIPQHNSQLTFQHSNTSLREPSKEEDAPD